MREKTKVTIVFETGDKDPKVITCDGIAFVTINDTGDEYRNSCGVIGNLSVEDLIYLHRSVQNHLADEIKKQTVSCAIESLLGE